MTTEHVFNERDLLKIYALGGLRIVWGSRPIPEREWNRRRAADLLRILIEGVHFRVHASQIEARLWPDSTQEAARTNLRVKIFELRSILRQYAPDGLDPRRDPPITFEAGMVSINPRYGPWMDSNVFEVAAIDALENGDDHSPAIVLAKSEEALRLWTGEYLLGEADDMSTARANRLSRLRRDLVLKMAELLENDTTRIERELSACFDDYPWDELVAERFISFLARDGRRARAFEIYQRHNRALHERSGLEASQRLAWLAGTVSSAPAAQRIGANKLIGRANEIQITELTMYGSNTDSNRSLEISGSRGVGRSRFLEELGELARQNGFVVAHARAYRDTVPETIVHQLTHELLRYASPHDASDVASRPPTEILRHVFERVGRAHPIILLVDDADLPVAPALEEVRAEISRSTVPFVLVTTRQRPEPSKSRETVAFSLHLRPLDAAESLEAVRSAFLGTVSDDLATAIRDLWPGNLSVIIPSALAAQVSGAAVKELDGWVLRPDINAIDLLSRETRESIEQRIADLNDEQRLILQAITLAGLRPSHRMIAQMLDSNVQHVGTTLEDIALTDLITYSESGYSVPKAVRLLIAARLDVARRELLMDRALYYRNVTAIMGEVPLHEEREAR